MGPLGELGALFNPGMRHEIEERQAKANRREEEGNARDGDLRIDLASGVAVINLSNGANGADRGAAPAGPAEPVTAPASLRGQSEQAGQADDEITPGAVHAAAPGREGNPRSTDDSVAVGSVVDDSVVDDSVADDSAAEKTVPDEPVRGVPAIDGATPETVREAKPLTAAQARRLATAARRSAGADQPPRTATPRPANAQLPSSKASRAAR